MATQIQKLKKNIAGFYDGHGQFHPIRSGVVKRTVKGKTTRSQSRTPYDPELGGDYDFPNEREERRTRNRKTAEKTWGKQELARVERDMNADADGYGKGSSLVQFVRAAGGIRETKNDAGELRLLSTKESGKRGLVTKTGGKTLDYMYQSALESGYALSDLYDLLDKLDDEISGGKATYATRGYQDYRDNPAAARRAKSKQPALDFTTGAGDTAFRIDVEQLDKPRFANLKGDGRDGNDVYYRDSLTGKRYFIRENPARKTAMKTTAKKKVSIATASKRAATAKKRTTAKKQARPRKNGILSALATAAVGTSAVLNVYDRLNRKTKTPTPAATGANKVLHSNRAKKRTPAKKKAAPKKNGIFSRVLGRAKQKSAKPSQLKNYFYVSVQDKVQGERVSIGEFNTKTAAQAIQQAKQHLKSKYGNLKDFSYFHALKTNSSSGEMKQNGLLGRIGGAVKRQRATNAYRRQLSAEAKLKRARAARSKRERAAKQNPTLKTNRAGSKSFAAFQGRPSMKDLNLVTPNGAPKTLYCLGKLLELRLKGKENLNFRREATGKTFYLCADEKNKQLWIAGGSIATPDKSIKAGFSAPLALITHVVYETKKVHLDDKGQQGYIHRFGEEGGKEPTLTIDAEGFPIIVGGTYEILPLGIAD